MKKRCLSAFVMLVVLCACSENKDVLSDEKASLYISSTVIVEGVDLSRTRAEADVNQFTLILENESNPEVTITGLFSDFPNGRVDDLPVGVYELTLTSHPDGFVPAFEDPWYKGIKNSIPVLSGRTNTVVVECVQANAGVSFIFDPSLEQVGLGAIVPEMTQGSSTLYFEGENRESKAYFLAEPVVLRIKLGNEYLSIGGQMSQTLDLGKEQLWETTLKASQITGKMSILASVKVITDPTHFIEFELGEIDPVEVTGIAVNAHTSSFLAKGKDVTAVKYGLFTKAAVDNYLLLLSPEDFMNSKGTDLPVPYLAQLNKEEGLQMNFDGMFAETEYSLMIMPTWNGTIKVQRYDFVSAEGIVPDPVQDPDGPIVPGTYTINMYQDVVDGVYMNPYENEITVVKALQDNIYIINNLFLCDDELIAKYNVRTGKLTFTGKDIMEYDIFNVAPYLLNKGEFYGGIFLTDGDALVDELVFTVENRKLSKADVAMEFRVFDGMTEEYLGWWDISPADNPFTFVSSSTEIVWDNMSLLRNGTFEKSTSAKRTMSTRAGQRVGLNSSVIIPQ